MSFPSRQDIISDCSKTGLAFITTQSQPVISVYSTNTQRCLDLHHCIGTAELGSKFGCILEEMWRPLLVQI